MADKKTSNPFVENTLSVLKQNRDSLAYSIKQREANPANLSNPEFASVTNSEKADLARIEAEIEKVEKTK